MGTLLLPKKGKKDALQGEETPKVYDQSEIDAALGIVAPSRLNGTYNADPLSQYGYTGENKTISDNLYNSAYNKTFNFDLNGNALYNQYKDYYTDRAGKAMDDAIGRAAALTGGYASSYAQRAGMSAYNDEMRNVDNIIPQLYEMAYNQFRDEKNDLLSQASYYAGLDNDEYTKALKLYEAANPTIDNPTIDESIIKQLMGMTNNAEIDNFLSGLAIAGKITAEQSGELYNQFSNKSYEGMTTVPVVGAENRGYGDWDLVNMGDGMNWWGIDRDVTVRLPNGDTITLGQLRQKLKEEGMKNKDANKIINQIYNQLKENSEK